jgi:hypothetical protein
MVVTVKSVVVKHWRPPGIMLMLSVALAVLVIVRGIVDDDWKVMVLGAGIVAVNGVELVAVNGVELWSSERRRRSGSATR